MEHLVNHLIQTGYLKTPAIISAFRKIKREDFIGAQNKHLASLNAPLPIGFKQTISQPLTVAFMLELLQPQKGDKILDIGAGSGWQTALLAEIVGSQGKIYALERIPELAEFGKNNVEKYSFINKQIVEFKCQDGSFGLPDKAPFDKIICAAAAGKLPDAWKKQLKVGGRIVAPINESIWLYVKKDQDHFEKKEFPGFAFVPLITDQ